MFFIFLSLKCSAICFSQLLFQTSRIDLWTWGNFEHFHFYQVYEQTLRWDCFSQTASNFSSIKVMICCVYIWIHQLQFQTKEMWIRFGFGSWNKSKIISQRWWQLSHCCCGYLSVLTLFHEMTQHKFALVWSVCPVMEFNQINKV